MSFFANAQAEANAYTIDNVLVTATATATSSSNISQEDANNIAQNLAQNLAQEKANNEVDIINQTLEINTINKGSFVSQNAINLVKEYLETYNGLSGASFSGYVFGNAFTNEEVFIGAGIGQKYDANGILVNKPIDETMIWRWASMTKLLGTIIFCKAIEDGLICTLEDPVSQYVPEVSNINTYISGSTFTGNYDNYGTPIYNVTITTQQGLGNTMTLRDLINSSSGLGYTFWGLGNTRINYLNQQSYTDFTTGITYPAGTLPPNNSTFANFIGYIQYLEKQTNINNGSDNVDVFTSYYYNKPVTFTDSILARIQFPLLCKPGTTTNTNYGADLNMLGAVISGALQNKGIQQNAAQYCQEKIFIPLEMNNTWLSCGSLPYVPDAPQKIVDCGFYRKNVFVQPNRFDAQKGVNVNYNTFYVSSDPNVSDDGFVSQSNKQVFNPYVGLPQNKYAGGFAESGVGPLTDYTKLLKLIINNGIIYKPINGQIQSVKILNQQSIEYLLTPKANTNLNDPTIGIWSCGAGTTNFVQPQETWGGGFAITDKYKGQSLPIGVGSNCNRWMAYYGHHYYFDTFTGNYLVGGSEDSFASWTPNNISFEPDYFKVWKILTLYN